MDIVQKAIEFYEEGRYEEAFELSAQFDRYQQDHFFKATGQMSREDMLKPRILVGAYKIEKEKDPDKRRKMMAHYDSLVAELDMLQSKVGESA